MLRLGEVTLSVQSIDIAGNTATGIATGAELEEITELTEEDINKIINSISTTDVVQMDDRRFEILTVENINESNELLEIQWR